MGQAEDLLAEGNRAIAQWRVSRDPAGLDAAIGAFRAAVNLPWDRSMDRTQCLANLIQSLQAGAGAGSGQSGSDQYCDEAINLITALPPDVRDLPFVIGTRGYCAMLRYSRHGSLDDVSMAVTDFKKAVAATPAGDQEIYRRTLNLAWACEARFDRLGARGEQYLVIESDDVERWRGPRDLVFPISLLENLLAGSQPAVPGPPAVVPQIKRNLANMLCKLALTVKARPVPARRADLARAVALLQQAMTEAEPGSLDHKTAATSLVAVVEQGQAAGLLRAG
jgi:hypothetical protein